MNTEGTVQYSTALKTQPTRNFKASKVQFYLKMTVSALVAAEQRNSNTWFALKSKLLAESEEA